MTFLEDTGFSDLTPDAQLLEPSGSNSRHTGHRNTDFQVERTYSPSSNQDQMLNPSRVMKLAVTQTGHCEARLTRIIYTFSPTRASRPGPEPLTTTRDPGREVRGCFHAQPRAVPMGQAGCTWSQARPRGVLCHREMKSQADVSADCPAHVSHGCGAGALGSQFCSLGFKNVLY